jgi:ceramidase
MFEGLIPVVMPQYCERDRFGFEIVNTTTNVGFWLAAVALYPHWRRHRSRFAVYAMALLVIVGLCSGLFHALRTRPLLILDAVPLYLLILSMAYRALSLVTRATVAVVFIFGVIAGGAIANAMTVDTAIHVASRHGVAVIAIVGLAFLIRGRNPTSGRWVAAAVALYAAALAAKTLDAAVCAFLPIGSHWLWHLTGALATYCGLRGVASLERGAGDW